MKEPRSTDRFRMRSAFTLIEIVAAMVLMTMLFAAMTSLLRSFSDQNKALERIAEQQPPTQRLADLMRQDFVNARFMRTSPGVVTLVGNLSRDSIGSSTGRRAEVTYRIKQIADEPWLMRRETQLDVLSSRRTNEEPIWRGALGIDVIAATVTEFDDAPASPEATYPGMLSMPARLRLVVRGESSPLLQLNIVHHWEDH